MGRGETQAAVAQRVAEQLYLVRREVAGAPLAGVLREELDGVAAAGLRLAQGIMTAAGRGHVREKEALVILIRPPEFGGSVRRR